jgi:hypothetical protein
MSETLLVKRMLVAIPDVNVVAMAPHLHTIPG